MPSWKKVIISGSDAALNSLNITNGFTASSPTSFGDSLTDVHSFTGSIYNTGSNFYINDLPNLITETRTVVVTTDGRLGYKVNAASSGTSGTSGTTGTSGTSGTSGTTGTSGTSGTSGADGTSGTSAIDGTSGTTGTSGTSGAQGPSGTSGTSGTDGTSGTTGTSGTSGTSGINGSSGGGGFIYEQTSSSTSWLITHSLDTRPLNVDIVDANYNLIITEDISFPTVDTAEINFPSATQGTAIFSSISASVDKATDLQLATDNGNITTNDMVVTGSGSSRLTLSGGTITASGDIQANNFITTSDKKLKSQITEIGSGLEVIKQFTSYEYIKNGEPDAGFIAQEVQKVLPYAVSTGSNGYLTMNDRPVLAHIHKAILELEERIKAIETQLG